MTFSSSMLAYQLMTSLWWSCLGSYIEISWLRLPCHIWKTLSCGKLLGPLSLMIFLFNKVVPKFSDQILIVYSNTVFPKRRFKKTCGFINRFFIDTQIETLSYYKVIEDLAPGPALSLSTDWVKHSALSILRFHNHLGIGGIIIHLTDNAMEVLRS